VRASWKVSLFTAAVLGYQVIHLARSSELDCSKLLVPGTSEHRALLRGIKSGADADFLKIYSEALARNPEIVSFIPQENLVYILDLYRPGHVSRLSEIIWAALQAVKPQSDMRPGDPTLISALLTVDALEVSEVLAFQIEILKLKTQHKVARALSDSAHGNQEYGQGRPYRYHLKQVRRVLKHFGFGPKDSALGLKLGTAALLHDILEDTPISWAIIRKLFGEDIASITERVTNEPRKPGTAKGRESETEREARKWRTYRRIAEDPRAVILKLADRIANTIESKHSFFNKPGEKNAWLKYKKEWEGGLKTALGTPPGTEAMWAFLERLMTDDDFVPDPDEFEWAN
jgi:hypothetical protein